MSPIDWQDNASRKIIFHKKKGRVANFRGVANTTSGQALSHLREHSLLVGRQSRCVPDRRIDPARRENVDTHRRESNSQAIRE